MAEHPQTASRDREGHPIAKDDDQGVATPSREWKALEKYRKLPALLDGGELALQVARGNYLWKAPKEHKDDYDRRVRSLQHHPFYLDACAHLGGQPFTKPITFSKDAPDEFREISGAWREDIDGAGRTLMQLARQTCINSTKAGFLLLWPRILPEADRPIMDTIPAAAVLDRYVPGNPVRIRWTSYEILHPATPWILTPIEQIWMFMDGGVIEGKDVAFVEVFEHSDRRNPKSDWNKKPTADLGADLGPLKTIPLYPLYTGNGSPPELSQLWHDPWITTPPLHPLSKMNQVYDNKRSDLDFGLHIGNIPQRCARGLTPDEREKIDTVGYTGMWAMERSEGRFYFMEPSGKTFTHSALDLADLERRMGIVGNQPNVTRADVTGNVLTATGELREMGPAILRAQSWAKNWQDTWETALRTFARIAGSSDKFKVTFDTNFKPKTNEVERWKVIQEDRKRRDISARQYLEMAAELGYPETFDPDEAVEYAMASESRELKQLEELSRQPTSNEEEEDE